ncbi:MULTISPECIES: 4-hydroxythreonine-4-phosphate dehydrogenase PdxA [unclassified Methylophilus]|uniref:4-hydroxythreonine-4-phosphate dehydrogenase PdxA n=1 Tax=unclassified Methylophilus TaxID=2630143 RepID=UPI0006FBE82D|nr:MULTISPECIES: 4-hydroxythreonine-4-phosphate dehydrogenase PdxA [unclassified Methylophilus]KQT41688.1 4-hydroxythreonine-4-phosphate dehydrogenase [Methylophilus sp. Leaf416]KQT55855.1 4-hydroxythreonine-4-phosphate dehydrogenase [Methylophilus sp. Leaf459]
MTTLPRIAITSGEPAGIGLDICVKLAHKPLPASLVVLADPHALKARAAELNLPLMLHTYHDTVPEHAGDGSLCVLPVPATTAVTAGSLETSNSQYVLAMLDRARDGCIANEFGAMVTAPVHKGIINDAGISFTGHTEYLAETTNTSQVVMMLVGGGMRVALATTHLPITQVSRAITQESLTITLRILHQDLIRKFGIPEPTIYVAGLNPHAGENGYLGDEEINTINPVLDALRAEGMHLIGALPADTMFSHKNLAKADAFLAMYHDQGLTVLKHASFGEGVNVTLGLPIIRTSVDHGTALDIAGTGQADVGSMLSAIHLAIEITQKRAAAQE